ncbi:hypothetical protein [Chitinimonas taiwanensis]|uniref:hypothetical protein n=1 Tax=Chitinimonas taiwanensis TaxID=240412 RepID=UPI0035B20358
MHKQTHQELQPLAGLPDRHEPESKSSRLLVCLAVLAILASSVVDGCAPAEAPAATEAYGSAEQ